MTQTANHRRLRLPLPHPPAGLLGTLIEIAGCAAVVAGVWLVSVPAALIIAGLLLVLLAQGVA